ncbi:hypothetical protein D6833_08560 [Candidatus Parcubacteria bacterium]|nr:MAG: hypothetical protein D6833_08560 [Candidatus Parcubacteria bacterium]
MPALPGNWRGWLDWSRPYYSYFVAFVKSRQMRMAQIQQKQNVWENSPSLCKNSQEQQLASLF